MIRSPILENGLRNVVSWLAATVVLVSLGALAGCSADAVATDPTCSDGARNGKETDVDCGGACAPCATGAKCAGAGDCAGGYCVNGLCIEPTCTDGKRNGMETDADCGGPACPPCASGRGCSGAGDCVSAVCTQGKCAEPGCNDGMKNGTEVDLDCGDGKCPACADGLACDKPSGCQSGICTAGKCVAASCTDGVKNGKETQVDCGDSCLCATGQSCAQNEDCKDGVCAGTCQAPTCADGVKNAGETGVDCGGPKCGPCDVGGGCVLGMDCVSGVCSGMTCAAPSCSDGLANGDETDKDCGGPTCKKPCADLEHCALDGDCASLHCKGLVCVAASCVDGIQNGGETALDCGGTCSGCADGATCLVGGDCLDGVCDGTSHCAAPTCKDGVKNQGETDVDCGGPNCLVYSCANMKACVAADDCASGQCLAKSCAPHGQSFGSGGIDKVASVVQVGNILASTFYDTLITGSFHGTVDFGTGPIASLGGTDVFVAILNSDGTPYWVKTFGGPGDDEGFAASYLGHLYVVGSFSGTAAFDFVNLVSGGGKDAFVASLRYDNGLVRWAKGFGGVGTEVASDVSVLGTQDAIVTGVFDSPSVDFGGGLVPSNGGSTFAARLNQVDGSLVWSNAYGGASAAHTSLVSADGAEEIVVAGAAVGDQDLGCGQKTGFGGADLFVTRRDPTDGHCLWSVVHGGSGDDYPTAMRENTALQRFVTGVFAPTANFGGANFPTGTMFIASYEDTAGAHLGSKAFGGGNGVDQILGISSDASNNLYITGRFTSSSLSFGGAALVNQGGNDVFLAKLGQVSFNHLASTSFGGPNDEQGLALSVSYYNNGVLLAGTFDQSINFGQGNLVSAGATDVFLESLGTFP